MTGEPFHDIHTDFAGDVSDLAFLLDAGWLRRSTVHTRVVPSKDGWEVHLVAADTRSPLRLISRHIDTLPTEKKAAFHAAAYLRTAESNRQEETQQTGYEDLDICTN